MGHSIYFTTQLIVITRVNYKYIHNNTILLNDHPLVDFYEHVNQDNKQPYLLSPIEYYCRGHT